MSFEKADLIDLRKLGVSSLLDLALILPKYEDYGVTPEPVLNTNASVQVEIISQKPQRVSYTSKLFVMNGAKISP